jgi:hypothetical protein
VVNVLASSYPSLTVARTFSRVLENGSKHKQ